METNGCRNSTIKTAYHVQFNKISDDKVLVIRVNIDACFVKIGTN
jgi:hypothetical protein